MWKKLLTSLFFVCTVCASAQAGFERIDGSFEDLYPPSFWESTTGKVIKYTAIYGGTAIAVGLATYLTVATAGAGGAMLASAPGWVTWVGSQIGMLTGVGSGSAAAGLAFLGGGTVASGGFGIAGGIAVLSGIAAIPSDLLLDVATDTVLPKGAGAQDIEKTRLIKVILPQKGGERIMALREKRDEALEKAQETFSSCLEGACRIEGAQRSSSVEICQKAYVRNVHAIKTSYDAKLQEYLNQSADTLESPYDLLLRAAIRFNRGDYQGARKDLERVRPYVENQAFILYMYALLDIADRNLDRAIDRLQSAIVLNPETPELYELQARLLVAKGRAREALDMLERFRDEVDDENLRITKLAADIAFHKVHAYRKAKKLYEAVLSDTTDDFAEAYLKYMIALADQRRGHLKASLDELHDALGEIEDHPRMQKAMVEAWKQDEPLSLDFYQSFKEDMENASPDPCA